MQPPAVNSWNVMVTKSNDVDGTCPGTHGGFIIRRDPFTPLTRHRRLGALRDSIARNLLRPFRATRVVRRSEGPPSLLIMAVDTLRADHVGRNAPGGSLTPALDRLRAEGTSFANVSSPAPWTLPAFTSALTGVMPGVHGAGMTGTTRNMAFEVPRALPADTVTLARHLGAQGYRTAAFHSNPFVTFGLAESFQEHHYRNHASADVAAGALDWIRRHGDRPFFCFVLFNDPHEPTLPRPHHFCPLMSAAGHDPAAWADNDLRSLARWGGTERAPHLGRVAVPLDAAARAALDVKLALYAGAIASVDTTIDAVLRQLEAWNLDSTTLVSVISDHGEEFLEHAAAADLWNHDPRDLRAIGHGHSLFQELLQVPWIVRGAGIPSGDVRRNHVSLCDVGPTLSDWLGTPALPLPDVGMQELKGIVQSRDGGSAPESRTLLAEDIAYGPDLVAVRKGQWKLIAHRDGRPLSLFDLDADPLEMIDVQEANPGPLKELGDVLTRWRAATTRNDGDGGGWETTDEKILRQLRELGYAE